MYTIVLVKSFKKCYKKLPKSIKTKFRKRVEMLVVDFYNPLLRVHKLKGEYAGHYSMDVTGDVRAIFKKEDNVLVLVFIDIGTHSQLY